MRPYTLEEIKSAFAPYDRAIWVDPDLKSISWEDQDFLAWKHPEAGSYYVCVDSREKLYGMVFKMNAGAGNLRGQCDLCHASNNIQGIKLALVETQDNPRRQLGVQVCADLACSERIRGLKAGIFMYETISVGKRIERLQMKIERFARKVHGVESAHSGLDSSVSGSLF